MRTQPAPRGAAAPGRGRRLRVLAAHLAPPVPLAPPLISKTDSWRLLKAHAQESGTEIPHLRELLSDAKRCEKMFAEHDGITLDYSRQARPRRRWRLHPPAGAALSAPPSAARHRAHHVAAV